MFDMNLLWENYMYYMLKRAGNEYGVEISGQQKKQFWHHEDDWDLRLKPDLVLTKGGTNIVIDTKWKYDSQISIQDVRQIYAYGDYFTASKNYLMYPDKLEKAEIEIREGRFYEADSEDNFKDKACSLMYINIIREEGLNMEIGNSILAKLFSV